MRRMFRSFTFIVINAYVYVSSLIINTQMNGVNYEKYRWKVLGLETCAVIQFQTFIRSVVCFSTLI